MDLNWLNELLKALGGAVTSVTNIADGFRRLIVTGVEGVDGVRARATYRRLLGQSASLVALNLSQRTLSGRLRGYVRDAPDLEAERRAELWADAMRDLEAVLVRLKDLLDDLLRERSEFVLEEPYRRLCQISGNPFSLLEVLRRDEPPCFPDELHLVGEVAECYSRLVAELDRARDEMNAYIKTLKQ